MSANMAWSQADQTADPLAMAGLDDLGEFFEFTDLDLSSLSNLDAGAFDAPHSAGTSTPFEEMNELQALAGGSSGLAPQGQFQAFNNSPLPTSNPYVNEDLYNATLQQPFGVGNNQFQFGAPQQQAFPNNQQQHVPPTPTSFDMHGEAGSFLQNLNRQQMDAQHRAVLEQRFQLRKDDIAFTPMVSPAGTPSHFAVQDYTINPGAYFSPLTSPALHAQTTPQFPHGFHTAASSAAASPRELPGAGDVDMLADDMLLPEAAKKPRTKRATAARTADPLARVRQSPIQKATKRKSSSMLASVAGPIASPRSLPLPAQPRTDSSEGGSISPEPLSEALMGPPPRPGAASVTASPALHAQAGEGTPTGKAATPKSFLSMPGTGTTDEDQLVDLQLPGAAADGHRPLLPQLDTQRIIPLPTSGGSSTHNTPRLAARKTPKLGPASTPSSARPPSSATASPSIMGSPMTASTLLKERKLDAKGRAAAAKKRGSVGGASALVSPALRPKISPSIKPLLPEGALHSPTHALLLATKSNYQNLLEGNMLPGVSYPDSLSTGLTSKRTSHKVAEQGRRNRINEALKEMQSLLPKPAKAAGKDGGSDGSPEPAADEKESKEDAAARSNSSKAATVESANEYIRQLQKENAQVAELKRQLEEMKCQLAQLSTGGNAVKSEGEEVQGGEEMVVEKDGAAVEAEG